MPNVTEMKLPPQITALEALAKFGGPLLLEPRPYKLLFPQGLLFGLYCHPSGLLWK